MKKRGELTTQQIVMLVILIVSFIVILIFIFLLNPKDVTRREICHNSVIISDKVGSLLSGLDCKTSYVCISGGGDCDNFNPSETRKIELKKDGQDQERIINATIKEMESCWWMFGEGKVKYLGGNPSGSDYCAICAIIAFDSEIKKEVKDIPYRELYGNMIRPKDDSQTHLKYLYNVGSVRQFEEKFHISDYLGNELEFDKQYFVLTGLSKNALWGAFDFLEDWTGGWYKGASPIPVTVLEKTRDNYDDKVGCVDFVMKA